MSSKNVKLILIAGLLITLGIQGTYAWGDRDRHGRHDWHHGHSRVVIVPPPVAPVIICPPRRVVVGAAVVIGPPPVVAVPAPVAVAPAPPAQAPAPDETATVWITNGNGSKSSVVLKKQKDGPGYIGPNGEYYSSMPTEDQLKSVYSIGGNTSQNNSFTVWLKNDNGSMTPVALTKKDGGYVGPSGEFYPNMPTEEQLKSLYGPKTNSTPAAKDANSTTVLVDNSDGSKTSVVLTKKGSQYVGPNGEYYPTMPTKEQLQSMYGQKIAKSEPTANNAVGATTVWVQNSDGSKTPVTLQKDGSEFVGPAGERYSSMPTQEQLQLLYGTSSKDGDQKELNFEITKFDGTKTVVALKKQGSDFVGPKGEHYPSIPTEDQLKAAYGK